MNEQKRITELEIRVAELERAHEEVSKIATEQWKTIENLRNAMKKIAERLVSLEEDSAVETPVTKPPHW